MQHSAVTSARRWQSTTSELMNLYNSLPTKSIYRVVPWTNTLHKQSDRLGKGFLSLNLSPRREVTNTTSANLSY